MSVAGSGRLQAAVGRRACGWRMTAGRCGSISMWAALAGMRGEVTHLLQVEPCHPCWMTMELCSKRI